MGDIKDDFADIIANNHGLFDGSHATLQPGLKNHESVESDVRPEGAVYEFRCTGCGAQTQFVLEYPELIALKWKLSPHLAFSGHAAQVCPNASHWRSHPGFWRLDQNCRCGWKLPLELPKNEPESMLRRARRDDYLDRDFEQKISNHCAAILQRLTQAQNARYQGGGGRRF